MKCGCSCRCAPTRLKCGRARSPPSVGLRRARRSRPAPIANRKWRLPARASTPVYNNPQLTLRLAEALKKGLGETNVVEMPQKMTSEDFAEYGVAGVPSALLHIGAVEPAKFAAAKQSGIPVPAPHSPEWAPEREPTLKGGDPRRSRRRCSNCSGHGHRRARATRHHGGHGGRGYTRPRRSVSGVAAAMRARTRTVTTADSARYTIG